MKMHVIDQPTIEQVIAFATWLYLNSELDRLIETGLGDSDTADEIRDKMDEPCEIMEGNQTLWAYARHVRV